MRLSFTRQRIGSAPSDCGRRTSGARRPLASTRAAARPHGEPVAGGRSRSISNQTAIGVARSMPQRCAIAATICSPRPPSLSRLCGRSGNANPAPGSRTSTRTRASLSSSMHRDPVGMRRARRGARCSRRAPSPADARRTRPARASRSSEMSSSQRRARVGALAVAGISSVRTSTARPSPALVGGLHILQVAPIRAA